MRPDAPKTAIVLPAHKAVLLVELLGWEMKAAAEPRRKRRETIFMLVDLDLVSGRSHSEGCEA